MSISNGQPVDAPNSNAAWISKDTDDTAVGRYDLANTNPASGPTSFNIQREINSLNSFLGRLAASVFNALPSWSSSVVGTPGDNVYQRADALTLKFRGGSGLGHNHNGTDGQSEAISGTDLINVRLKGFFLQGTDLTGVTGGSTNVTTQLTGKTPSLNETTAGVVVNTPYNRVILRYASGTSTDDEILDTLGNEVYGRVTESAGVWTLTYYVLLSGTETPYSFGSATDVRWYYQELFNPLSATSPVYNPLSAIPSENTTSDVVDASATQRGVVSTGTQSFAGIKTFLGNLIAQAKFQGEIATDSTTTGSNAILPAPNVTTVRVTNVSLVSIEMISNISNNQFFVLINKTGAAITILNNTGATASQRILTGTGADLTLANDASLWFFYDTTSTRWVVVGGSGSGGGAYFVTGTRASPQNITAGGGIAFTGGQARQLWFAQGSGGHVDVTANPQIAVGSVVGQELLLIGRNDSQTIKLEDGTGLSMNGSIFLAEDVQIKFIWDGTNWAETYRSQ